MIKSADAFRTISEVADWLGTPTHVLRFWESKFSQIKPVKRAGGRRYYRPQDMLLIGGIKQLLHKDGLTIKGVQKILREQGAKHVCGLSQPLGSEQSQSEPVKVTHNSAFEEKATDWQPMKISDFATDISEDNSVNFLELHENNSIDNDLDRDTYSTSLNKVNDTAEGYESHVVDPLAGEELCDPPMQDDASQETLKAINSNTPANLEIQEELDSKNLLNKKPKVSSKGKENFEKSTASFDKDQSELKFWADDKVTNAAKANLPQKTQPEIASMVEPSFQSVMTHLSRGYKIDFEKAALLKPTFLKLEKRLAQRRSGNFK